MLTASISIFALIGLSILGYVAYSYRKLAIDNHLKFISTREFAESVSKEVLELRVANESLKSSIASITHSNMECLDTNRNLRDKLDTLTPKAKQPKQAKSINSNKNTPSPTMKGEKTKTKTK